MAQLPEIRARELIQNVGIVKAGTSGEGLARLGLGLANLGGEIGAAEERERKIAEAAYIADIEVRNRERIAQISAEDRLSPERLNERVKGHIAGVLSTVPERLRPRIEPRLRAQAVGEYSQALDRAAVQERTLRLDALQSNMNSYLEEWKSLADAGLAGSSQAQAARNRMIESGDALVTSGFKSKDSLTNALKDADDEVYGRSILAFNRETYRKQGFGAAWKELHETFSTDPVLQNTRSRSKLLNSGQEFLKEQTAALNRVDEMADRQIKRAENSAAKSGWEMFNRQKDAGNFSGMRGWLDKNWHYLPLDEAKAMRRATERPDPEVNDLDALSSIDNALRGREDAKPLITRLHAEGKIKTQTAEEYFNKNRDQLFRQQPKSPFEMAVDSLEDSFDPGLFKMDIDSKGRRRAAIERFQLEHMEENERRKKDGLAPLNIRETLEMRDNVRDRFMLQEWESLSKMFERPRFLVGSRNAPNIEATEFATIQALNGGRITQAEAERQAIILKDWRMADQRRKSVKEKKK